MRQGMKSFVGTSTQKKKKQSSLSRLLTYLLLAAAVGVLTSMIRALKADRLNLEPAPAERIDDGDTREKLKALGYVQ